MTFDEASFRLVPVYKKVWFIRGEKPKGVFYWSNKKLIVFGALIDGKKFYFEFYDKMNTTTYKSFLTHFIKKLPRGKYVFLFDNAPYHKSAGIKEFLSYKKSIFPEFFPTYSPELNPTETVWKITRENVTNNAYFQTLIQLQGAIGNFLEKNIFMLNISNYLCR